MQMYSQHSHMVHGASCVYVHNVESKCSLIGLYLENIQEIKSVTSVCLLLQTTTVYNFSGILSRKQYVL